jgi:hypothetical protein
MIAGGFLDRNSLYLVERNLILPVTDLFDDPRSRTDLRFAFTESLFCCVFGLMEERGALPKQRSTRERNYAEWCVESF